MRRPDKETDSLTLSNNTAEEKLWLTKMENAPINVVVEDQIGKWILAQGCLRSFQKPPRKNCWNSAHQSGARTVAACTRGH